MFRSRNFFCFLNPDQEPSIKQAKFGKKLTSYSFVTYTTYGYGTLLKRPGPDLDRGKQNADPKQCFICKKKSYRSMELRTKPDSLTTGIRKVTIYRRTKDFGVGDHS